MKEILESKVMIGFAVFVIGFAFLTSTIEAQKNDLHATTSQLNQNVIK